MICCTGDFVSGQNLPFRMWKLCRGAIFLETGRGLYKNGGVCYDFRIRDDRKVIL